MKIKKKLKVIIPSAVLVVGIVLAVIGLAMGAKGDYVKSLELTDFEANVPSSGVFNLDINVSLADLILRRTIFQSNFWIILLLIILLNSDMRLKNGIRQHLYPAFFISKGK